MENLKDLITRYNQLEINFTDRESYFVWVNAWKRFYKELSQDIREVNAYIREVQRNPTGISNENMSAKVKVPRILEGGEAHWRLAHNLENLKEHARCALRRRATAKVESWEKKLERQKLEKVS